MKMAMKSILFLMLLIMLSCSSISTNFKVQSDIREINFKCNEDNYNTENNPLFDIFMDTSISLQVINISNDELYFFHDKTFVIPYYKPRHIHPKTIRQLSSILMKIKMKFLAGLVQFILTHLLLIKSILSQHLSILVHTELRNMIL